MVRFTVDDGNIATEITLIIENVSAERVRAERVT